MLACFEEFPELMRLCLHLRAQLLLDASINDDWGSLRGNPAKL
jgi:hypothetical protein